MPHLFAHYSIDGHLKCFFFSAVTKHSCTHVSVDMFSVAFDVYLTVQLLGHTVTCGGFPGGVVVKNLPASAGDTRDRFNPRVRNAGVQPQQDPGVPSG